MYVSCLSSVFHDAFTCRVFLNGANARSKREKTGAVIISKRAKLAYIFPITTLPAKPYLRAPFLGIRLFFLGIRFLFLEFAEATLASLKKNATGRIKNRLEEKLATWLQEHFCLFMWFVLSSVVRLWFVIIIFSFIHAGFFIYIFFYHW